MAAWPADSPPPRPRLAALAAVSLLALSAAGCGGGGGGPTASAPTTPPPAWTTANGETPAQARALDRSARSHQANADFRYQWGLEAVNAHQAYARLDQAGLTADPGTGTNVWFIDTGLDVDHPAMDPDRLAEVYLDAFPTDEICQHGDPAICDLTDFSHGTAVASIVAADPERGAEAFDPPQLRGLAWGANVGMLAIPTEDPPTGPYAPSSQADLADDNLLAALAFACVLDLATCAGRAGAANPVHPDFLNLSLGAPGLIQHYSEADLRAVLPDAIEAMAQTAAGEKTVLVWAAGNDHGEGCTAGDPRLGSACVPATRAGGATGTLDAASPDPWGGLMARIPELRGHSIVVVSVRENDPADPAKDGSISDFSNRCGIAADWCIAAPGEDMVVASWDATDGPAIWEGGIDGTSFAAPMVTGGLAVMNQVFRGQLTPVQLAARLLGTANNRGIYADRATYGRGLMDLGAATAPVGNPALARGATVDGPGVALGATRIRAGAAFGDGISRALAGREVAAFDDLGAPFWYRLDSLASRPAAAPTVPATPRGAADGPASAPGPVSARTAAGPTPARIRFGMVETAAPGHAGLAGDAVALAFDAADGIAAAAFTTSGIPGRRPVSGASLSYRVQGGTAGIRAGWIGESGSLLGTETKGAFGPVSGDSVFVGMTTGLGSVDGWRLGADAEIGVVSARPGGGLLRSVSQLATSAFAVDGARTLAGGDEIAIRVSQPLRLEDGQGAFAVPLGRTGEGAVLRSRFTADLDPSGRQVDVSARWRRPLAETAHLGLGLTWTRHPGHDSTARPAARVRATVSVEF